jgi:NAD(P)H dehydrogenase (quinone)
MGKILVAGAAGQVGTKTLQHLLKRKPAGELVGLVRDPDKAGALADAGIEIRLGDYFDYDSVLRALDGIEKVLLISTHAFTDREAQHENVINAAIVAGVQHVLYTPISRKKGSAFAMPEITPADVFTEDALKASGLTYTILGHPPFMESLLGYIGGPGVYATGVRAPAGNGKVAPTTREDLAEAQAVVLTEHGHENKTYELLGDPAVSFADIAETLSEITGTEVPYVQVSDKDFTEYLFSLGMPESTAGFFLDWMRGINGGEWDGPVGDLERLLGHKPTTLHEFLRHRYSVDRAGPASA